MVLGGATIINGAYVYIRTWGKYFELNRVATTLCPVTVNFIEVPMELRPIIRELASVFGKVLFVNEGKYYNPSPVIRTVILYDLSKPIVDKVNFVIGSRTYSIKVAFFNVPNICNQYHLKGH